MSSTEEYEQQQYWKDEIVLGEGLWKKLDRECLKPQDFKLTEETLREFFNNYRKQYERN